ncbi:MAG: hypothetical protein ACTSX1_05080 [Candidatus Heimdallarchaeaceae archaeon]
MAENEKIIADLLNEFREHRNAIMNMIGDLEGIKSHIDRLIPERLDARYVRFFEEKVKSITALFNALLDMRKELTKSLKDEIEIRRKIDITSGGQTLTEIIDIRDIAARVERFKKKQDQLKGKSIESAKRETDEISRTIDVTKVSSSEGQ